MELKNPLSKKKSTRSFLRKIFSIKSLMTIFGVLWAATIIIFLVFIIIGSNFFQTTVDQGPLQDDIWGSILVLDILIGIVAFLIFAIFLTIFSVHKKTNHKSSLLTKIKNFLMFFVLLAILPLYLLIKIWKPKKIFSIIKIFKKQSKKSILFRTFKKTLVSIPIILILIPVWALGYLSTGILTADQLGLITQSSSISGTGSMYPTFPKGEGEDPIELSNQIVSTQGMFPYPNGLVLFGKRYFGHQIQRGDIVIVEDDKTRKSTEETYGDPSGWVKRVIAISGDKLEIRDGIVYLNNEALLEPYTAKPRSTFAESFLQECQEVTIPENSVFVMGDNRTGSGDSREVGFFSIDDIHHVLPLENQEGELTKNWRNTDNDLVESSRIKLDKEKYLESLNQKRESEGLKPLKYQEKLEESARKRGEVILEYDDYSFEATASGYTMKKAMNDVGYQNTIWGEAPTPGYYEYHELLDNQLEFAESKKFIFDPEFQDLGIAEVQGEVNGCPTHIIVQHFAGYVPPNYSAADIQSWENVIGSLRNIQPGWNDLKNSGDFYNRNKDKADRINQIIDLRINKTTDILGTMKANRWLSAAQISYIENEDVALRREQEEIATFLNGQ